MIRHTISPKAPSLVSCFPYTLSGLSFLPIKPSVISHLFVSISKVPHNNKPLLYHFLCSHNELKANLSSPKNMKDDSIPPSFSFNPSFSFLCPPYHTFTTTKIISPKMGNHETQHLSTPQNCSYRSKLIPPKTIINHTTTKLLIHPFHSYFHQTT